MSEMETIKGVNNTADIFTRLIQEAGRWCESYASDLLVDIDSVKDAIRPEAVWSDRLDFAKDAEGKGYLEFMFGFRRCGVDHKAYIDAMYDCNKNNADNYYRAIWRLRVYRTLGGNYEMVLTRTH